MSLSASPCKQPNFNCMINRTMLLVIWKNKLIYKPISWLSARNMCRVPLIQDSTEIYCILCSSRLFCFAIVPHIRWIMFLNCRGTFCPILDWCFCAKTSLKNQQKCDLFWWRIAFFCKVSFWLRGSATLGLIHLTFSVKMFVFLYLPYLLGFKWTAKTGGMCVCMSNNSVFTLPCVKVCVFMWLCCGPHPFPFQVRCVSSS